MKKLILFAMFFTLFGCTVGDFPEHRNKLHKGGNDSEICKTEPNRCVNGVVW